MIEPRIDAALVTLRVGLACACALLFTAPLAKLEALFAGQPIRLFLLGVMAVGAILTAFALLTRIASSVIGLPWLWALYTPFQVPGAGPPPRPPLSPPAP